MTVVTPGPFDEQPNLSPVFVADPSAPGTPRADLTVVPEGAKFGASARWDTKPWHARAREWVQHQFADNDSVLARASNEAIWDIVEREYRGGTTPDFDAVVAFKQDWEAIYVHWALDFEPWAKYKIGHAILETKVTGQVPPELPAEPPNHRRPF